MSNTADWLTFISAPKDTECGKAGVKLWHMLCDAFGDQMPAPTGAGGTEQEDCFQMVFDMGIHHFEVDIYTNKDDIEWFYLNRETGERDSENEGEVGITPHFRQVFDRSLVRDDRQ